MNGSTTDNNWNNVWNQTQDLNLTSGKNLFTATGWSGSQFNGNWSTK
jgi:hypothetical protein